MSGTMTGDFCDSCKEPCARGFDVCEDCCDHEYDADEGFICLNCGREGAEDVMAQAYDAAKARRQDG